MLKNVSAQRGVFNNEISLYRIYFCSGLHRKSKFCENGGLSLYKLTLCGHRIFDAVKIKKYKLISSKVTYSKIQESSETFSQECVLGAPDDKQ